MSTPVFLDTNILVYLFDSGSPVKQKRAREIVDEHARTGRALLSTQVLQEFYVAVTRKLTKTLDEATAERAVHDLAVLPTVRIDIPMILAAVARSRCGHFSLWDALIVEAAIAGGARRLYSEDLQHGRTIEGVLIENPFLRK